MEKDAKVHSLSKLAILQPWACVQAFIKVEQASTAMDAAAASSGSPTDLSTLAAGLTVTTSAAQVGIVCSTCCPAALQHMVALI